MPRGGGRPKGSKDTFQRKRASYPKHVLERRSQKRNERSIAKTRKENNTLDSFIVGGHKESTTPAGGIRDSSSDSILDPAGEATEISTGGESNNKTQSMDIEEEASKDDSSSAGEPFDPNDFDDLCEDDIFDEDGQEYDSDSDDERNQEKRKKGKQPKTIMSDYIDAVVEEIKEEKKSSATRSWLLKLLAEHEFWIPSHRALFVCGKLGIPVISKHYFRDLFVWLPDLKHKGFRIPCPNCGCNGRTGAHAFRENGRNGKMIYGLHDPYYILTQRYICHQCHETRRKNDLIDTENTDSEEEDVECSETTDDSDFLFYDHNKSKTKTKKLQYTFMGWNKKCLRQLPLPIQAEFPAFVTHKRGVDKKMLDWMRPMFMSGTRPSTFANMLREMYTKRYTERFIQHEFEEYSTVNNLSVSRHHFSEFADRRHYYGCVPSHHYIKLIYIKFIESVSSHMENEIKKRDCNFLCIDNTYQVPNYLARFFSEKLFDSFCNITNEIGEIRKLFPTNGDGHDQLREPIKQMLKTMKVHGQALPKLAFSDKPAQEASFLSSLIPSLSSDDCLEQLTETSLTKFCLNEKDWKVVRTQNSISAHCNAIRTLEKKGNVVGLDVEWPTSRDRAGNINGSGKVTLLQLSFCDKNDCTHIVLFHFLPRMKTLPIGLILLLSDRSITFSGVGVKADVTRLINSYNCDQLCGKVKTMDLGQMARKRDVVKNGKVSLKLLSKIVLGKLMDKSESIRCSDWGARLLSFEQQKYAATDAYASLHIYLELMKLPDLDKRLCDVDAQVGVAVNVVPRHGSVNIGLLATRAAVGTITDNEVVNSPQNVTPLSKSVTKATSRSITGKVNRYKTCAVRVTEVLAQGLVVPYLKKSDGGKVTLESFGPPPFTVLLPVDMLSKHNPHESYRTIGNTSTSTKNNNTTSVPTPSTSVSTTSTSASTIPGPASLPIASGTNTQTTSTPTPSASASTTSTSTSTTPGPASLPIASGTNTQTTSTPTPSASGYTTSTSTSTIPKPASLPTDSEIDAATVALLDSHQDTDWDSDDDGDGINIDELREQNEFSTAQQHLDFNKNQVDLIRRAADSTTPTSDHPKLEKARTDIDDIVKKVLGDAFHFMNRGRVPVRHEAKKAYYYALQQAFFVFDEEVFSKVEAKLKEEGFTDKQIESKMFFDNRFFCSCCPRIIPKPSILYKRVRKVFATFGDIKDSNSGKPLFNDDAWKKANNVLQDIANGYASDPPGVAFYTPAVKRDGTPRTNKYGLPLYLCLRGTNKTEAVHRWMKHAFAEFKVGLQMTNALLKDFVHRYNHRVSQRARIGFPMIGHYDTWLIDVLVYFYYENHGKQLYPGWSCSCDFVTTSESSFLEPIVDSDLIVAINKKFREAPPNLTSEQIFIASQTGTSLPILPLVSKEEFQLFAKLMLKMKEPYDFDEMAHEWLDYVDGKTIFPKMKSYLQRHYKKFEKNQRIDMMKQTKKNDLENMNNYLDSNEPDEKKAIINLQDERETLTGVAPQFEASINLTAGSKSSNNITSGTNQNPVILLNVPPPPPGRFFANQGFPYFNTANTPFNVTPISVNPVTEYNQKKRGKDKNPGSRTRRCQRCLRNNASVETALACKGRGGERWCKNYSA